MSVDTQEILTVLAELETWLAQSQGKGMDPRQLKRVGAKVRMLKAKVLAKAAEG